MRFMRLGIWLVVATLAASGVAHAQSTSGTISGRVVDAQERPVPGVTVSVESANLQGIRTAVTSENGDYIFTLLPSGQYTITFELSGFERQQRTVTVAPTQVVPIDVTMGLAGVSETVEVVGRVGRRADADGAGGDQLLSQDLIASAADQPRHQRHAAARAVGAPDRPERRPTRSRDRCRTRTCS